MKQKKLFLALIACLFAAGTIINMHLAQNDHNTDISLADISVMAQADGESGGSTDCWNEYDRNGTETHKICEIWVGGTYHSCKDVIDLSWVNMLGTCPFE